MPLRELWRGTLTNRCRYAKDPGKKSTVHRDGRSEERMQVEDENRVGVPSGSGGRCRCKQTGGLDVFFNHRV
jgi:hypothetical protein